MKTNDFAVWAIFIGFLTIWHLFSHSVFSALKIALITIGLPVFVIQLILLALPWIVSVEVVTKLAILQISMPPLKFISTQVELWNWLDCNELNPLYFRN
jgi:hypothetical protein